MAKAKQFTIAVHNELGVVAGIAKILGDAKVNILALLAVARGANGTVELVVDNAVRAKKALAEANITFQEAVADEYELPNRPGELARCLGRLAAKGVNLNSICATRGQSDQIECERQMQPEPMRNSEARHLLERCD